MVESTIVEDIESEDDFIKAIGVGLKESEWARYDELAKLYGITRNALAAYGLRDFLERLDGGDAALPIRVKKTL